jgi:hypothetical protein
LQSDPTPAKPEGSNQNTPARNNPVVPANANAIRKARPIKDDTVGGYNGQKDYTAEDLELSVDPMLFPEIMSKDIHNLISKDSNPKVFEYIDFKYEAYHFEDFSKMADEFRMLQKFWIANRKLINSGVKNSDNVVQAQVKNFLLHGLEHDKELRMHTKDLQKFYYLMSRLEQKLTGWINPYYADLASLYDTFVPGSQAIVIPIGNEFMSLGATVIKAIRNIHKVDIPIHIYYIGDGDLSWDNRNILEGLADDVYTHDITKFLDDRIVKLGGWALKPFAALLAPAQHVMLIDADITFIQSPEGFFKHPGYTEKKSLFFYDRNMSPSDKEHAEWALSFIMKDGDYKDLHPKYLSDTDQAEPIIYGKYTVPERLKESRYLTLEAAHEQESGVVLIDKLERFIPLIATCSMNNKYEREHITYKMVHGDKETFWMGYEMVGGEYAWNPHPPGMISDARIEPDEKKIDLSKLSRNFKWKGSQKICSTQILHFDHNNKPYWFNGGLYANKIYKEWGLHEFKHYLQGSQPTWKLGKSNWVCLTSADAEVQELDKTTAETIKKTKEIFTELKRKHSFDRLENKQKEVSDKNPDGEAINGPNKEPEKKPDEGANEK